MKCADCRFSHDRGNIPAQYKTHVECRFNPPFLVENPDGTSPYKSVFPVVSLNCWCGKFEPK